MSSEYSNIDKGNLRLEFYSLLQSFETYPASQNFFLVQIEKIPQNLLTTGNLKSLGVQRTYGNIDKTKEVFKKYLEGYFYLATGVDLTAEKTNVSSQGITKNGLLPVGPFMDSREYPDTDLDIQFQETNVSFVDHIIRPWIQLYATYGNFADNDLTSNVTIYFLSKETVSSRSFFATSTAKPIVRKTYKYYDCIPYNIQSANVAEYTGDSQIGSIATTWRFSKYDVITPFK